LSGFSGGFDERLSLLVGDAQAHAVDKYHVEFPGLVEFIDGQLRDFDERAVVVGFGNLSEGDCLIVDEGYARGRGAFMP
jgi:hypothetical protein